MVQKGFLPPTAASEFFFGNRIVKVLERIDFD